MTLEVYEIAVQGIRCTNCSKRILAAFEGVPEIHAINVSVLAEKVQVSYRECGVQNLERTVAKLRQLGFKIIDAPQKIALDNDTSRRQLYFDVQCAQLAQAKAVDGTSALVAEAVQMRSTEQLLQELRQMPGVIQAETVLQSRCEAPAERISVSYNPVLVSARHIYEYIVANSQTVNVHDEHLNAFRARTATRESVSVKDVLISLAIVLWFLLFIMLFPYLHNGAQILTYPLQWNIFSVYLLTLAASGALVVWRYGLRTYTQAWRNWRLQNSLNMETLIALSSVASFTMAILLTLIYTKQIHDNQLPEDAESALHLRKMMVIEVLEMIESGSLILAIVNVGKFLEGRAKSTILMMAQQLFPEEQLLQNCLVNHVEVRDRRYAIEKEQQYDVSLLDRGDIIRLRAPMRLLVDGIIVVFPKTQDAPADNSGAATAQTEETPFTVVDSICYGNDVPFAPKRGERLRSGAQILSGEALLMVENTVEQSILIKVSKQLQIAQNESDSSESALSGLFLTLSKHFVKGVLLASLATLLVWSLIIALAPISADENSSSADTTTEFKQCRWCVPLQRAIAVLVVSCPCALGLAIPSVIATTLNLALSHSLLLKKNSVFEKILAVRAVIFDKTGTLFTKLRAVSDFCVLQKNSTNLAQFSLYDFYIKKSVDELWSLVALLERDSQHPLAELLYKESLRRSENVTTPYRLIGALTMHKNGVVAYVTRGANAARHKVCIGSEAFLQTQGVRILDTEKQNLLQQQAATNNNENDNDNKSQGTGKAFTFIYLSIDETARLVISLDNSANLRSEARAVVHYLQEVLKKDVYILSGDSRETVAGVGEFLNLPPERVIGETDAEGKVALLRELRNKHGVEALMIGDGLNDVLCLQEAHVGVAINAKSELNLIACDVIALSENLWKIPTLFVLLKKARLFIIANLLWAFAYNLFAMPAAAGVFVPFNVQLSSVAASAFMSGSSLIVVLFSNLMRFIQYDPGASFEFSNQQTLQAPNEQIVISLQNISKHLLELSETKSDQQTRESTAKGEQETDCRLKNDRV